MSAKIRQRRRTATVRRVTEAAAPGLATLAEKVDPRWVALVIVDYQNDFCHPRGAFARTGFDPAPLQAIAPSIRAMVLERRLTPGGPGRQPPAWDRP